VVFWGFQKLGVNFASRRFKQMVRVKVSLGKEGREDRTRNHHRNQHRRFIVRGYWPGPASGWKDQRMRWIEPYWKGPDIAAVIKRAYKLKP
jgi:hypothetical protein